MAENQMAGLKEGLKRNRQTIISSVVSGRKASTEDIVQEKVHAHFYLSASVLDRMREFQVRNRKEFPRISHVIEEALKQFLKQK